MLTVTALNPEAGNHPIPRDPREIDAAIRAGKRCLQEFPYFQWRYGERGERFTNSDGAWLVTLAGYPEESVLRQVNWLGGLLATRGMPRILLQRHLELLYEELLIGVPERAADYQKLIAAAEDLAKQRRSQIDDETFAALTRDFQERIGRDWQNRLPGTGAMIVCAVADERSGVARAMSSLIDWLCDPGRFPEHWIDAVRSTVHACEEATNQ